MEYYKLVAGLVLVAGLGWLFYRTQQKKGFGMAVARVDMVIGIIAGLYLVVTSLAALL